MKGKNGLFVGNMEMIMLYPIVRNRLDELKAELKIESNVATAFSEENAEKLHEYNLLVTVFKRISKYIQQGRNPYVQLTSSEKEDSGEAEVKEQATHLFVAS